MSFYRLFPSFFPTASKATYEPSNEKFFVGILRTEMISTATTTTIGVAATTCYNGIYL